jgi:hypothetical protein
MISGSSKSGFIVVLVVVPIVVGITQLDTVYVLPIFSFLFGVLFLCGFLQFKKWNDLKSIKSTSAEASHQELHKFIVIVVSMLGTFGAGAGYYFTSNYEGIIENPLPTFIFFSVSIGIFSISAFVFSRRMIRKLGN